jgi:hypothetical protein
MQNVCECCRALSLSRCEEAGVSNQQGEYCFAGDAKVSLP